MNVEQQSAETWLCLSCIVQLYSFSAQCDFQILCFINILYVQSEYLKFGLFSMQAPWN